MTQRDKLIERFRSRPIEMPFDDVRQVLEWHDGSLHRHTGSHAVFVKPGETSIAVPRHHGRMVKRVYIDIICKRLGVDDD